MKPGTCKALNRLHDVIDTQYLDGNELPLCAACYVGDMRP